MSRTIAIQRFKELVVDPTGKFVTSSGKALAHSLFPDEFEFYMIGIELEDDLGLVTDRLVFPVTPKSISLGSTKIVNVKKTASAVVTLFSNSFVPVDITFTGNFGRRFRILVGSFFDNKTEGNNVFDTTVKTGFGLIKLLERFFDKSTELTPRGKPYRVYLYNLTHSQTLLVDMISLQHNMDESTNMIWNYTLTMKGSSAVVGERTGERTNKLMTASSINSGLDVLASQARTFINSARNFR